MRLRHRGNSPYDERQQVVKEKVNSFFIAAKQKIKGGIAVSSY